MRGPAEILKGLDLIVAGLSDPAKMLDFPDPAAILAGGWDPSLVRVAAGRP